MPAGAILIVRRIVASESLSLAARPAGAAFEAATRTQVDRCLAVAARPIEGSVDPAAEAVLFADEAELLAVLALDLRRGRWRSAWYWREALRALELPPVAGGSVGAVWAARPRAVPGALELLARWRTLDQVDAVLPEADARAVTVSIAREVGLPWAAVESLASANLGEEPFVIDESTGRSVRTPAGESPRFGQSLLPAVGDTLGGAAARLSALQVLRCVASASLAARGRRRSDLEWRTMLRLAAEGAGRPTTGVPSEFDRSDSEHDRGSPRGGAQSSAARGERDYRRLGGEARPPVAGSRPARAAARGVSGAPSNPSRVTSLEHDSVALPPPADSIWHSTALGGVLYLFNVWPLECEQSVEDDEPIGPAALVELLARHALRSNDDALADDPLWGLLAELDGRRTDRPIAPSTVRAQTQRVDHRVARLAEDVAAGDPDALADELRCRARFHCGRTHLDVIFPIDSISVAVRCAGLDRDPGWLSELQRVITFRFQ